MSASIRPFLSVFIIHYLIMVSAGSASPDAAARTMRLAVFGSHPEVFRYGLDKAKLPLDTHPGSLSGDMPCPEGGVLRLFRPVAPPKPGGDPWEEAGAIELPAARKCLVVLMLPAHPEREPVRGRAFADSPELHHSETARVLNLSHHRIGVLAGSSHLELDGGKTGTLPWKEVRYHCSNFRVGIMDKPDAPGQVIAGGEAAARPGLRFFLIIADRTENGPVSVLSSVDAAPAATPP